MKKYIKLTYLITFIFLFLSIENIIKYSRKNNKILVTGNILGFSKGGSNSGTFIDYQYSFQNKVYNGTDTKTVNGRIFIKKKFPVVINKKWPSSSKILLLPENFEEYGYSFPDSLKWVLNYKNSAKSY
jgi:hypothetical protein